MVSSPKDQKQGDSTEKQADPISIYNQLDHRHKQKSAYQEHKMCIRDRMRIANNVSVAQLDRATAS